MMLQGCEASGLNTVLFPEHGHYLSERLEKLSMPLAPQMRFGTGTPQHGYSSTGRTFP